MSPEKENLPADMLQLGEKRNAEAGLELGNQEASSSTIGTAADPFPDGGLRVSDASSRLISGMACRAR